MLGALLVSFIFTPQASPSTQAQHNAQWHMQSMHSCSCILLVGIISILPQASSIKGQQKCMTASGLNVWCTIVRPHLHTTSVIILSVSSLHWAFEGCKKMADPRECLALQARGLDACMDVNQNRVLKATTSPLTTLSLHLFHQTLRLVVNCLLSLICHPWLSVLSCSLRPKMAPMIMLPSLVGSIHHLVMTYLNTLR